MISFPVPGGASFLEPTDLNADSHTDFVIVGTAFEKPAHLSIVYGTPDGEFEARPPQVLDVAPHDIELVDVDADGDLDVVMVEFSDNVVHVLLQTAPGVFHASEGVTTVSAPRRIVAGDLNLDGRDDLVVRPYWSNELGIHLALEGGGFAPVETLPFQEYYAQGFEIGDVTRDGKPDLVFALWSTVEIWPGNGAGGFGAPIRAANYPSRDVAIEDVDADGHPDIVALGIRSFRVLLARSATHFDPVAEYQTAMYSSNTVGLTTGDLNRDGYPDVLVSNQQTHRMLNFLGTGDGTFEQGEDLVASSSRALVMDVTADGKADVVLPDGKLTVLPGNGDGSFVRRREYNVGHQGSGHAVGDLNGDGELDVVAASPTTGVSVLLGQGGGELSLGASPEVDLSGSVVELADVNADGVLDVIVGGGPYPSGLVSVLLGRGDASFGGVIETEVSAHPSRIRTADLNRDGHLDVIVSVRLDFEGTGGMSVLLGDGTGAFPSRTDYSLGPAQDVVVGDFDNDANLDIVLVTSWGVMRPYLGDGAGTFREGALQWLDGGGGWAMETADLDRDGHLDLVAGAGLYSNNGSIDIFRGSGDGSFVLHQALPFGDPLSLAIVDLDGDGFEDLAVGGYGRRAVTVFVGDGRGEFTEHAGYGAVDTAKQIRIADMDGDDAPDLVTTNLFGPAVSVLLSNPIITPVLMSNLRASPRDGGIRIEWEVSIEPGAEVQVLRVARASTSHGPFEPISPALRPRSLMSFLDDAPRADTPWYRIEAVLKNGSVTVIGPVYAVAGSSSHSEFTVRSSGAGVLHVRYALARAGNVDLDVYDVRGRLVHSLVDAFQPPGTHALDWNWAQRDGNVVAHGVYVVHLRALGVRKSRKIVLLHR